MSDNISQPAGLQRFANKTVIVTGAGSGIGQATALRVATEGGQVVAVDLNKEGLEQTVSQAESLAGSVRSYPCSVASEDQVKALIADVIANEGKLDSLINMAGILRSMPSTQTSLEEFQQILNVNLIGTFLCCREALPELEKTKGSIVNAASTSAQYGHPYMAAYAASKGGVYAMTRTLAWEYLKKGVRVNAVAPGGILTPMVIAQGDRMAELDMDLFAHLSRPDGQFGTPEQVAAVIAMLASDDGGHMTGEVVKVDGGVHN